MTEGVRCLWFFLLIVSCDNHFEVMSIFLSEYENQLACIKFSGQCSSAVSSKTHCAAVFDEYLVFWHHGMACFRHPGSYGVSQLPRYFQVSIRSSIVEPSSSRTPTRNRVEHSWQDLSMLHLAQVELLAWLSRHLIVSHRVGSSPSHSE